MWLRRKFLSMTDLERERKAIDVARRCQRNWDYSKPIPEEHIEHWIYLATHAPSKQDETFFDLYVLTDRELLESLYRDHTWGFTMFPNGLDYVARNPQMNAPVLFVYNMKMDVNEIRNNNKDGSVRDPNAASRWDNAYTAVGISSGIVAFSAANMGYNTGYGKNFGYLENPDSQQVWGDALGIKSEDNRIAYSLGIGYGNENLQWNESIDNKEFITNGPLVENAQIKEMKTDYKYSKLSELERNIRVIRI